MACGCFAGFFNRLASDEEDLNRSHTGPPRPPIRRRSVISIRRKGGQGADNLLEAGRWIYRLVCTEDVEKVYTLQRQLGKGSFATVYLAQHKETGFTRAVKKICKPKGSCNSEVLSEIYALMDLDHPHIIRLSRMYDGEQFLYIVSELCTGPSLFQRIADGPMSEQEQGRALRHILKALRCCHAHYMGHYDIKPDNFMYAEPDLFSLKMIDLGFSSSFIHGCSDFKGSYNYMAPEVHGGIYGPEADIWSCSVLMFEMATRKNFVPSSTQKSAVSELVRRQTWIKGKYDQVKKSFGVSDNFMSLLVQMLRIDRHMRITAADALAHPYIVHTYKKDDARSEEMEKAVLVLQSMVTMFESFGAETVFVRAVLLVLVHLVAYSSDETRANRRAYAMLDRMGVSEISEEAIEAGFANYGLEVPENLHEAFSAVALHDGYITYSDFLAATLPQTLRCREDLCLRAFTLLDRNRDGVIGSDDLESIFLSRDEQSSEDFQTLIGEAMQEAAGTSENPNLNFEDFLKLVLGGRQLIPSPAPTVRTPRA